MGEMGFDSGGDEGKGVAALLTTGFDYRQHRLDKATAAALCVPNDSFRQITA